MQPSPQHHVFLSYSRRDLAMMQRVRDTLRAGGLDVWTDDNLEPGTPSWQDAIQTALESSKSIVVILSPDSKQSEWVKRELNYASTFDLRIFPVLASGSDKESIPLLLVGAQYVDLRKAVDQGLEQLRRAVHQFVGVPLPAPPPGPTPPPVEPSAPPLVSQQLVMSPPPRALVWLRRSGPLILLPLLALILSAASAAFLSGTNIASILMQTAIVALPAVGMTYIVLSGGLDMSVGALLALCTVVMGRFANQPLVTLAVIGLATGGIVGLLIGWLVGRLRVSSVLQLDLQPATAGLVPALLITLFATYFANSAALIISDGLPTQLPNSDEIRALMSTAGGIPLLTILVLAVCIVMGLILERTPLRRQFHLMRTDRQAARGLPQRRLLLTVHGLMGLLVGLTAFAQIVRIRSAFPNLGTGLELTVIAAVLLGGTSLFRSEGSIWRSLVGALLMVIIQNGLVLLGVSAFWQQVPTLLLIILFVWLDYATLPRARVIRVNSKV